MVVETKFGVTNSMLPVIVNNSFYGAFLKPEDMNRAEEVFKKLSESPHNYKYE